jgi:hypothetical protein
VARRDPEARELISIDLEIRDAVILDQVMVGTIWATLEESNISAAKSRIASCSRRVGSKDEGAGKWFEGIPARRHRANSVRREV